MIRYKIRPYFLPLIRSGKKKHEYRLANRNVAVGDRLLLVSNSDESDCVTVRVVGIEHYGNWREALADRWEGEFQGLYDTFDVLIEECEGYYSEEDVERYGINAFEIVAVE